MSRDKETVEHERKEAIAEETGLRRETIDVVTDDSWADKYGSLTRRQALKAGAGAGAGALALRHGTGESEALVVSGTVLVGGVLLGAGAGMVIASLWGGDDLQGEHATQDSANDNSQWREQTAVASTSISDQRYRDLNQAQSQISSTRQSGNSRAKYEVMNTLKDGTSKAEAINTVSTSVNDHFSIPVKGILYNQESTVRWFLNNVLVLYDLENSAGYDDLLAGLENNSSVLVDNLNRGDSPWDGNPGASWFTNRNYWQAGGNQNGYTPIWCSYDSHVSGKNALEWSSVTLQNGETIENLPHVIHPMSDGNTDTFAGYADLTYWAGDGSADLRTGSVGNDYTSIGDDMTQSLGIHWALDTDGDEEPNEYVTINPAFMVKSVIGELETSRAQTVSDLGTIVDEVYAKYSQEEVAEWWSDEYINPTDAIVSDVTTVDDEDDITDRLIQRVSHATGLQVSAPSSSMTIRTWEWDPSRGAKTNLTEHEYVSGVTWYERDKMSESSLTVGQDYINDGAESPQGTTVVGNHSIISRNEETGQGETIEQFGPNEGFTIVSLENTEEDTLTVDNNEFSTTSTDDLRQQSSDWYETREELSDDGGAAFGGFGSLTNLGILGGGSALAYGIWRYYSDPKGEF